MTPSETFFPSLILIPEKDFQFTQAVSGKTKFCFIVLGILGAEFWINIGSNNF